MAVDITAIPYSALVDDDVKVCVTGLSPRHHITMIAVLMENGATFVSSAHYIADDDGIVNLVTAASVGGTYVGVEPMGLLWSMRLAPGQRPGLRLIKQDLSRPFVITLSVMDGHRTVTSPEDIRADDVLASCELHRYYLAPGVREYRVCAGNVRGMLFIPSGAGPFPGVIDMFGTAGGLIKFRAALLASRGFVTLALPYFGYEDLPVNMVLNLEYFDEAVDWLSAQPYVLSTGIGLVGVSKGGAIAMHMATSNSKIKAVVAINTYCVQNSGMHYYHGYEQPMMNVFDMVPTDEGYKFGEGTAYCEQLHRDALIHIETAESAAFLFIVGEDDMSSDPSHISVLTSLLQQNGKSNYTVLSYPGAGHLIEPPYTPLCRVAYAKLVGTTVLYGGQPLGHARAQEDSWRQIQTFLRNRLVRADAAKSEFLHSKLHTSKL